MGKPGSDEVQQFLNFDPMSSSCVHSLRAACNWSFGSDRCHDAKGTPEAALSGVRHRSLETQRGRALCILIPWVGYPPGLSLD